MSKRYTHPPLVEALCEFQFDPSTAWDLTLIGLIYDQLKDMFPKREQLQVSLSGTVPPEINIQIGTIGTVPLVRFLDADKKTLVQVGQNLLTVNHLQPYTTWENFFPFIEKGFMPAQHNYLGHQGALTSSFEGLKDLAQRRLLETSTSTMLLLEGQFQWLENYYVFRNDAEVRNVLREHPFMAQQFM